VPSPGTAAGQGVGCAGAGDVAYMAAAYWKDRRGAQRLEKGAVAAGDGDDELAVRKAG
jgi:hypothetical protein